VAVLQPATVARLGRLRLAGRRRVEGRFAGAHLSRRYGASLDFADYREYVPGDDLRRIDVHAYARLGKRLVKLYEAEDEAALRVVVDLSASMRFGRKLEVARSIAAGLAVVATGGGDRVRVLLAGASTDPGPWFRGGAALPAVDARLSGSEAAGQADLPAALRRAVGDGPRGPVVLVSDLMFEGWEATLDTLSLGRADTCLVHVLARTDIDPDLDGDVRLVDSETGADVEVGVAAAALDEYRDVVAGWLSHVRGACGARGIAYAQLVDDEGVEDFFLTRLPATGLVA
jgi:uncharacterized protein (DUF58 family)